jgi:hypothetical protein
VIRGTHIAEKAFVKARRCDGEDSQATKADSNRRYFNARTLNLPQTATTKHGVSVSKQAYCRPGSVCGPETDRQICNAKLHLHFGEIRLFEA